MRCAVGIRRAGQFAGAAFAVGVVASGTIQLVTGVDPAVREEIADRLLTAGTIGTVTGGGAVPAAAGLMARRGNGHFLRRAAAVLTFDREGDGIGAGGLLRKLFVSEPAVRGLLLEYVGAFGAFDGMGLAVGIVDKGLFMCFLHAGDRLLAGGAVFHMVFAVVQGTPFVRGGVGAARGGDCAAAGADEVSVRIWLGGVVVAVVDPAAGFPGDAVARAAVALVAHAAADVPATGERITEDEDVAAAAGEGFVGEAVAGVDGCLAGGVHPAGCLGEVEFAERAIGIVSAAAERDAVFVEAAPEAGEICARAEAAVDVVEGGLIVAEGGPAVRELINAEGFCAGGKLTVVERGEIKTAVERAFGDAGPVTGEEGAWLVERCGYGLVEDDLGDDVGERFAGENLIGDWPVGPEAEDAEINVDLGGVAGFLALFAALGVKRERFLAPVALFVFGADAEFKFEIFTGGIGRDRGMEDVFLGTVGALAGGGFGKKVWTRLPFSRR